MPKPVAFILGGSRGIGRGAAEQFAKDGYNIALVARTSSDLQDASRSCTQLGAEVITFTLDVTNDNLLKRAVDQTVEAFGSIDVLICAAGFTTVAPLDKMPAEELDRCLNVNFRAPVYATRFCMPYMGRAHNTGAIIYIASTTVGQLGYPGFSSYTGSKTALNGFAKGIFEEVRGRGIKVSTIYPAMTNSGIGNELNNFFGLVENYHTISQKEMLQISDVVKAIMFIVNSGNTCCTCELTLQPQKQAVTELTYFTDKRPVKAPSIPMDLSKKVALITGASKGIGRCIAERMASHGYDLALVARGRPALEETAEACRVHGVRVIVLPTDLTNVKALEDMVEETVKQLGNINVLINNAAINRRKSSLFAGGEIWDKIIDTNFRAAIQTSRAVLPYMAQNTNGTRAVIYISSSVVLLPGMAGVAPYFATKHAVNGFVGSFFEDIRHLGIKVSTICPGLVNTELGTKKGPVENPASSQLIQCTDCADAVDYVLNSSETCCPLSMMIHPQAASAVAIKKFREKLEEKFASSKL